MENRNMERYMFVKNRYYPGKLLHASDFIREQEYGNAKLEFLNRKLHGWGIIQGLEVRPGEKNMLCVTAGSAIDRRGRLIVMPQDTVTEIEELKGRADQEAPDFILGIEYDEKAVEKERSLLSEEEVYKDARIAEGYVLKAYSVEEWKRLRAEGKFSLTEERVLYEDGEVRLSLRIPEVVPTDSVFKICIQATALIQGAVSIGWRCTAKLQGAFFLASGRSLQIMEEPQTVISGNLYQEWQICTEEYRKQTVALELSHLEILRQGEVPVEAQACQTYIDTVSSYEDAVRGRLQRREDMAEGEAWVPLARIRTGREPQSAVHVTEDEPGLRRRVAQSEETEFIRRGAEENGIIDIRWRGLLKNLRSREPYFPGPVPPVEPPKPYPQRDPEHPRDPEPPRDPEHPPGGRWEQVHRGVAVIPIPKRYRKGDTLFSEEISHGFPGEEVFIWLERLHEEPSYAYWEKERTRHAAVHGADDLFADGWYSGWEIQKQALRREVEAGTFQIALILSRGRRRRQCREVAMAWTAVRLTEAAKPNLPAEPIRPAEAIWPTEPIRSTESNPQTTQTPPERQTSERRSF